MRAASLFVCCNLIVWLRIITDRRGYSMVVNEASSCANMEFGYIELFLLHQVILLDYKLFGYEAVTLLDKYAINAFV